MLAIFKESAETIITPPLLSWARSEWRKALDKGQVLSSFELSSQWERLYPEVSSAGLAEWCQSLSFDWILSSANDVREIFAHSPKLIESVGNTRTSISSPLAQEDWELWVETLAALVRIEFNYSHPCGSAYWKSPQGEWRITFLHQSVAPEGNAKVFCRKLAGRSLEIENFGLPSTESALLKKLVGEQENILIAGSTGSGKTTLLSSLLSHAESDEHVVILEDTQEISCQHERTTRMLASRQTGRSLGDYLAHSLRVSPDRILVGEMRSHEVVPYILAMNTGHRGLMSTIHASSAVDALLRVAQLFVLASGQKDMSYQEVLKLVCRNVGTVVFVEKRKIKEIIKVYGSDGDMPLYDVAYKSL